jgi:hypothetical protein
MYLDRSSNILHIKAFPVVTVRSLGDTLQYKTEYEDYWLADVIPGMTSWMRDTMLLVEQLPETYHDGEFRLQAFWRTLIGNCNIATKTYPAPKSFADNFTVFTASIAKL